MQRDRQWPLKLCQSHNWNNCWLALDGKPDGKAASDLDDVQLTERVGAARLARWEAEFPGAHTHEELMKLADLSAFLDPPGSEAVPDPRPDVKTQLSILSMAVHYVADTMPRLPDFYATRMTTHFENNLSQPSTSISGNSVELASFRHDSTQGTVSRDAGRRSRMRT